MFGTLGRQRPPSAQTNRTMHFGTTTEVRGRGQLPCNCATGVTRPFFGEITPAISGDATWQPLHRLPSGMSNLQGIRRHTAVPCRVNCYGNHAKCERLLIVLGAVEPVQCLLPGESVDCRG